MIVCIVEYGVGNLLLRENDVRNNHLPSHQATRGQVNTIVQIPVGASEDQSPSTSHPNCCTIEQQVEEMVDNSIVKTLMKASNLRCYLNQLGFNEEENFAVAACHHQDIYKAVRGTHNTTNQLVEWVVKGHENTILFTNAEVCIKNPNCKLYVQTCAQSPSLCRVQTMSIL